MKSKDPNEEFPMVGISPLGGNAADGADIEAVPLVYDERVGAWISKLAQIELNDRDISECRAREYRDQEEFNARAGYEKL